MRKICIYKLVARSLSCQAETAAAIRSEQAAACVVAKCEDIRRRDHELSRDLRVGHGPVSSLPRRRAWRCANRAGRDRRGRRRERIRHAFDPGPQGRAPGATELAQLLSASRVIEGRYHPALQPNRDCRTGLVDCHAGVATASFVHVLQRCDPRPTAHRRSSTLRRRASCGTGRGVMRLFPRACAGRDPRRALSCLRGHRCPATPALPSRRRDDDAARPVAAGRGGAVAGVARPSARPRCR